MPTTATRPICLCGCVSTDEAVRLRRERAKRAEAEHAADSEAFERYYADLTAKRPTRTPAEYVAEVRKERGL